MVAEDRVYQMNNSVKHEISSRARRKIRKGVERPDGVWLTVHQGAEVTFRKVSFRCKCETSLNRIGSDDKVKAQMICQKRGRFLASYLKHSLTRRSRHTGQATTADSSSSPCQSFTLAELTALYFSRDALRELQRSSNPSTVQCRQSAPRCRPPVTSFCAALRSRPRCR